MHVPQMIFIQESRGQLRCLPDLRALSAYLQLMKRRSGRPDSRLSSLCRPWYSKGVRTGFCLHRPSTATNGCRARMPSGQVSALVTLVLLGNLLVEGTEPATRQCSCRPSVHSARLSNSNRLRDQGLADSRSNRASLLHFGHGDGRQRPPPTPSWIRVTS